MQKTIFLILFSFFCSTCLAQEIPNNVSRKATRICYHKGVDGIGGLNHCLKIELEDSLLFVRRICYSMLNMHLKINKDVNSEKSEDERQAILRCYQDENLDSIVLDERIEINHFQYNEFVRIINDIRAFASVSESQEGIVSTGMITYMISDQTEEDVIIDRLSIYDRIRDIEETLGLLSYSRCPCVQKDRILRKKEIEQIHKESRKNRK